MLENVERIGWTNLGVHVYGEPEKIPDELRNLLSSDTQIREAARGFLLGSGQDYGDIYDTTPHIVPFVIELLRADTTPDKEELLAHLSSVAEHIYSSRQLTVHKMRHYLHTYDALKAGLPTLRQLLKHSDLATRIASIDMVQYMTDDVLLLVPELIDHFRDERDEPAQVAILQSIKTLIGSLGWALDDAQKQYGPFLRAVVDTHESHTTRVAAARASIELVHPYTQKYDVLSPHVPALLSREFLEQSQSIDDVTWPSKDVENIVRDLVRLQPEIAIKVLHRPDLTPQQAHILARGLLRSAFLSADQVRWNWEYFPRLNEQGERLIYVRHFVAASYIPYGRTHILEAIVNTDTVWHIPTNLFSFYFGLPDSREALRTLLTQQRNASVHTQSTGQEQDFDTLEF
ncbi:MAG: hypothetical protein M3R24_34630 [Chloroflexota bacterium]|nr:hypothetical protein [Chloroflexota bacterium]